MQKGVCLKKYFPNQQKKEHRRPHAAAPANNDWLYFPVEWRGQNLKNNLWIIRASEEQQQQRLT